MQDSRWEEKDLALSIRVRANGPAEEAEQQNVDLDVLIIQ